jgi:hypothetical protein
MFSNGFLKDHAVYDVMWKNIEEPGGRQMAVCCMLRARWITKATNTHSEYVILILLHGNNGCTNAPQCYIIRTWPVFLCICTQLGSTTDGTTTLRHTGHVTTHYMTYHLFDLYFK